MGFRVFVCVAVAILGYLWLTRISKQVRNTNNNTTHEDSPAATAAAACIAPIKTSDDLLVYTKNCLGYPKKSMDCILQRIKMQEKYAFVVAIECTPGMPESLKIILRQFWENLDANKKIDDVESFCREDENKDSKEGCAELLDMYRKNNKEMIQTIFLLVKLNDPSEEVFEKFQLFVNKVGFSRFD